MSMSTEYVSVGIKKAFESTECIKSKILNYSDVYGDKLYSSDEGDTIMTV